MISVDVDESTLEEPYGSAYVDRWGNLGSPIGHPDYLADDGLDRYNALEQYLLGVRSANDLRNGVTEPIVGGTD